MKFLLYLFFLMALSLPQKVMAMVVVVEPEAQRITVGDTIAELIQRYTAEKSASLEAFIQAHSAERFSRALILVALIQHYHADFSAHIAALVSRILKEKDFFAKQETTIALIRYSHKDLLHHLDTVFNSHDYDERVALALVQSWCEEFLPYLQYLEETGVILKHRRDDGPYTVLCEALTKTQHPELIALHELLINYPQPIVL